MSGLVMGVPAAVLELVQEGLLERAFHDGLVPALLYRSEAAWEEWPANTGTEIFMTRPGLLPVVTKPLAVGQDPQPQVVSYEQWAARLDRFGSTIDTHIPTSTVANSDQFLRNIHQLGIQAGMSLNRIPRNSLFQAYLSGQTVLIEATGTTSRAIRVASLNGFTDVVTKGKNVRPRPVSPSTPLAIKIGTVTGTRNVVGYDPDNPDDPNGPGTLLLDAAVGSVVPARAPVLSVAAPMIIRSGGGSSVDAIGSGDTFTLQDAINATSRLRKANVPPHEDGFYHAHISNDGNSQVFSDPALQRALTALPDSTYYQQAFLGTMAGIAFYLNNEAPEAGNSGAMTATGTNAYYSEDLGAETVNESGVGIGRIVITGRGAMIERALDEKQYVTEAGITGKIGEFSIVNNGISVETNGVRLILRAPVNRLQDVVAATWSISTSFPIPSDITSGGPERFKRAVVIEHALN